MSSSEVGNHGAGAQTLHSGAGSQSINAADGQQHNTHIATSYQFFYPPSFNTDRRQLVGDKGEGVITRSKVDSPQHSITEAVDWLSKISKKGHADGQPPSFYQLKRHRSLLGEQTPGTGEWLMESPTFVDWKNNNGGFLWLDGIMGAGKSVLASMVTRHLETQSLCCTYVYFHDDDKSQPTLESLYANILEQLLRHLSQKLDPGRAVCDKLQQYVDPSQSHGLTPTSEEYLVILAREAQAVPKVYLIVDGLDAHDTKLRDLFLWGIRELSSKWNVLVTSRRGTFNHNRLESDQELEVKATDGDIQLYIDRRIEKNVQISLLPWVRLSEDVGFKNSIYETIVQRAGGMFLLVKMHMDRLSSHSFMVPGEVRAVLSSLPEGKDKTFESACQRIQELGENDREIALHVLSWVEFSERPITAGEVAHAFAVKKHTSSLNREYALANEQLTSPCAGIIVTDQQHCLLRAVHDDVMVHVRGSNLLPENPEREIAMECLAYLSINKFSKRSISDEKLSRYFLRYPLLNYAANYWYTHYRRAQQEQRLSERVLDFLENRTCLSFSFQVRDRSLARGVSGLHACAYLDDATDLAAALLERGMEVDATTEDLQTPLHWAVHYGRVGLVQLLLKHKAAVDAKDRQGNTPIYIAVCRDRERVEMVRHLIDAGAKLDVRNIKGLTPLRWALKYGLRDVAIPLIRSKAELDVEDSDGWTPLRCSVYWRPENEMVELLLINGYDVNHRSSKDGWTALGHASRVGNRGLARLLLNHKANVNLRDQDDGRTPLQWAIMYGHTPVAELLLEQPEVDVNAGCRDQWTPLIQAARALNRRVAWLLLDRGAKVDDQEKDGHTALHYAMEQGHKSLVWLLVECGASLNLRDSRGRTPLHQAVARQDSSMVWYLVERGADLTVADEEGCQPLHLAAKQGLHKIVELLIGNGVDANAQDNHGLTPLHHAVREDAEPEQKNTSAIMSLVKSNHVNLDKTDENGQTALMYAAQRGNELVTVYLAKHDADTLVRDSRHMTASDYAEKGGHKVIFHILSEYCQPQRADG